MAVQSRRVKLIADCLLGVAERFYRRISICGATLRYWRKRVRVERTIDTARRQSPVLKMCSPTSLLCGVNDLASRYVVLFGLNCAPRHATMQPKDATQCRSVSRLLRQALSRQPTSQAAS